MAMNRREFIAASIGAGAYLALGGPAWAIGSRRQGIVSIEGSVLMRGEPASVGMVVQAGDVIETLGGSSAVFVMGKSAFLMRERTRLSIPLEGNPAPMPLDKGLTKDVFKQLRKTSVSVIRLERGGLLSVFKRGPQRRVVMTTSVAGVRGTAMYTEVLPDGRNYICTCYGTVDIESLAQPGVVERVKTRHHDAPRYINAAPSGPAIEPAPVINHTDEELEMLEGLVGRRPPFKPGEAHY